MAEVYKPEEIICADVIANAFVSGAAQVWEGAKMALVFGQVKAVEESKVDFFKSLDGLLSRKFVETEALSRETLEKFNKYRDLDWSKKEITDEITLEIKRILEAVRQEMKKRSNPVGLIEQPLESISEDLGFKHEETEKRFVNLFNDVATASSSKFLVSGDEMEELKLNFFENFDAFRKAGYKEYRNINAKSLEELDEFRNIEWTQAVAKEIFKLMRKLTGE
jgi:hypothetical protein